MEKKENEIINVSFMDNKNYIYDSFEIINIDLFLEKLKDDPLIAEKYKKMNKEEFRQWIENGITYRQFDKLKSLLS